MAEKLNTVVKPINDSTFSIVLQTSKLDSKEFVYSDVTVFNNIKWALCVKNIDGTFYCLLTSGGYNNVWEAKVSTVCRLLRNDKSVVTATRRKLDIDPILYCDDIFSYPNISKVPANCLSNGEVTLECDIEILEISGNYPDRSINFKESSDLTDTIMMVGDETLYVNKQILSNSSPVFKKMFDSEDMEEIVHLKDENPKHFIDFLQLLYNVDVQIKPRTFADLLKFAKMFETPSVTQKCELYLVDVPNWLITLKDMKMYAEKYGLKDLAKECELDEKEQANRSVFSKLITYFSDKLYI